MGVAIGVDSHKSSLAAATIDLVGRVQEVRQFPNDQGGHRDFVDWVQAQDAARVIGIEGARGFAAALTDQLLGAGEDVVEVPAFMTHRERRKAPAKGKSDPTDAVAIARVVAREKTLGSARRDALLGDLKLLSDRRDDLVKRRVAIANKLHKELVVSHPGYEATIPRLTRPKHFKAVLMLVRGGRSVRARLIRDYVDELRRLDALIAAVTRDIAAGVKQSKTSLTSIKGVSFVLAAKILGEVGDPARLRTKAGFAMLNGTAPIAASSGNTVRHRLNRGGNRTLNFALHMMALARCRYDPDTRGYIARRLESGNSRREALRCLKRQLSNVVYRHLMLDLQQAELAA